MKEITITTNDAVELAGLLWDNSSTRSVLLLHMMPATKESWMALAEKLSVKGLNVLAIDFRGHGKSGGGDYTKFSPEQHYGYFDDVRASMKFLTEKYPSGSIIPGGASIGANLALWLLSEHAAMPKAFALSAGLDYYGVRAIDFVQKFSQNQKALFVGSYDDGRKSGKDCGHMAEELFDNATSKKEKIIYETGGHGTDMFSTHTDLPDRIVAFLTD